jgi:hypothetical protein
MHCPYDAFAEIDDRGRDLADMYDDLGHEIEEIEELLAFKVSLLPILQKQLEDYVQRVKDESRFVPQLPKLFDQSIGFYLRQLKTDWDTLAAKGATDAELAKILRSPGNSCSPAYRYRWRRGQQLAIYYTTLRTADDEVLIEGTAAVVAEVRRIMGIPQPVGKGEEGKGKGERPAASVSDRTAKKSNAQKPAASARKPKPPAKKTKPVRSAAVKAKKSNTEKGNTEKGSGAGGEGPENSNGVPLLADKGPVKPEDWQQARDLIAAKPHEFAALKKRLRRMPSTAQVLKYLSVPATTTLGAAERIVAHAKGELPDASTADFDLATYEADVLADETLASGDVEQPPPPVMNNGVHPGPKTLTLTAPNPGRSSARRKVAGVKR